MQLDTHTLRRRRHQIYLPIMNHKDYMIERNAEPLGDGDGDVELHSLSRKGAMSHDEHDMQVLGRVQQLNVSGGRI